MGKGAGENCPLIKDILKNAGNKHKINDFQDGAEQNPANLLEHRVERL